VKAAHAPALEGVNADPLELKLTVVTEHGLDAGHDLLGLLFLLRVGMPTELKVDAIDVVGLAVQQHRLTRVKRRVKPEPALGGKSAFITTSAIRKRSMKILPSISSFIMRRMR
jgi:hypothetical protein